MNPHDRSAYTQVPQMFLEFGFPLLVDLYIQQPGSPTPQPFLKKGEVLELKYVGQFTSASMYRIFALKSDLPKAMENLQANQEARAKELTKGQEAREATQEILKDDATTTDIEWIG